MTHPLIEVARQYIGCPYVWAGKKDFLFDPVKLALVPNPWRPARVFDCSGLVTVSLKDAGGPDWRASHSSGALRAFCWPVPWPELQPGDLLFRAGHVGIYVSKSEASLANIVVLEAAGGDRSTTSPFIAEARKAEVREHSIPITRFACAGRLDFDSLLKKKEENG